jgi:hypothetical protein
MMKNAGRINGRPHLEIPIGYILDNMVLHQKLRCKLQQKLSVCSSSSSFNT